MNVVRGLKYALCALFILPVLVSAGEPFKTEFALTLDASGHAVIAHPGRVVDSKIGLGGSLGFEVRPLKLLAGGVQAALRTYPGSASWSITSLDVTGKLFPLGRSAKGEAYLEGGVGILVPKENDVDPQGKRVHGTVGAGYRLFCKSSQTRFLDLGVVLDSYSPQNTPLTSLGVKVGLGWMFGSNRPAPPAKAEHVKASTTLKDATTSQDDTMIDPKTGKRVSKMDAKAVDAAPTNAVDAQVSDVVAAERMGTDRVILYEVEKGDCLWSISGKEEIYDDPTQWPRIYKANKDQIKDPNLIQPKQELKVINPNKVTDATTTTTTTTQP